MEYGPRALGNRSILYQPTDPSVNDWLNERLARTEFMPFAPVTLWERRNDCFHRVSGAEDAARFMTITFDCTDRMKDTCAGVVHIDGTARPQLVVERDNPSYHRILCEFKRLTDNSTIVNTSFNIHEEPIVCTPQDVALADARRAIMMYQQLNVSCLGIIENMSYHLCTECGHREEMFDHGGAARAASDLGVPFLGEIPLNIDVRIHGDSGTPEQIFTDTKDYVHSAIQNVIKNVAGQISIKSSTQDAAPTLSIS